MPQISNTFSYHFSTNLPELSTAPPQKMSKTTTSDGESLSNHLESPTLDKEFPTLLHSISEHGGYAYVRMAALAAAGDIRAAEASREMAWEQLHSGPWHSVLPVWRDAYSMACFHVAKHHYDNGEFKEALRALDMGIIMGGTLLRKDLDSAVDKVSEKARMARVSDRSFQGLGNSEHRLVDHEFDVSKVRSVSHFYFLHQYMHSFNFEHYYCCCCCYKIIINYYEHLNGEVSVADINISYCQ